MAASAAVATAATFAATWVRRHFVVITVDGMSMTPSLYPGQRVLVRRGVGALGRGRIVVLAKPDPLTGWLDSPPTGRDLESTDWYIKRVVAVAGDPYPDALGGTGTVPAGHVAVLGDHPYSQDSRRHGPCPVNQILGVQIRKLDRPGTS